MGGLSNEIPNLILMVLILLSKDAMLHKVGAEVINSTRQSTQNRKQMKPR